MLQLHLPWLELAVAAPLVGAVWVWRLRDAEAARRHCIAITAITLLLAFGAWRDFETLRATQAHDRWDALTTLFGREIFTIDERSAPIIPLAALQYLVTTVATMRTKVRRFSFGSALFSESMLLALFSCTIPWLVVGLLVLSTIPPLLELRSRGRPVRLYSLHMALFAALLVGGWLLVDLAAPGSMRTIAGVCAVSAAILLRSGILPFHLWLTDLFENASFGTALLFVTPMSGAYAAIRLLLPTAPDWILHTIALLSLTTAVYAAGMAIVQKDTRRFFAYLLLSHSALVLVGLEIATPVGLTGALCVWLSVGLALTGLGLTLRSLESRAGRLSLAKYHGLYEHVPALAAFFLLTGLASVGFPGTFGFVGMELLADGVVQVYSYVGMVVVFAAALNGIAVLRVYFRLFTAARHVASISLRGRPTERWSALALSALILGCGLIPQPGIQSRYRAAQEIIQQRQPLQEVPSPHEFAMTVHSNNT